MKRTLAWLLTILLSGTTVAQTKSDSKSQQLVFTHVTVIDVAARDSEHALKTDQTVIISGTRIATVGKRIRAPKGALVIDATGEYLIPGLWDMHVHTLSKGLPDLFFPLFVANGVTGVRDMGGDIPLQQISRIKREITSEARLGPKIVAAGPILEGARPFWSFSIPVKDASEGKRAVDELVENGADFIKVYNTLSREAYVAIAEEARQKQISFVGHVPDGMSSLEASRAGQKSIEHLWSIPVDVCRDAETLRSRTSQANAEENPAKARDLFFGINQDILTHYDEVKAANLFREFAANGTWQTPTLTVLRAYAWIHNSSLRADPRIAYIPPGIRNFWGSMGGQPDPRNDKIQNQLFEHDLEIVAALHRAGVKVLSGTDTPNPYTYPGFSLHEELELLVKAGFTPLEALQSATINPARFLNLENTLGTVEKGKIADLVLLDANPLDSIGNTRRIFAVVTNGRYLPKSYLRKMLADVEAAASKK